MEVFIPIAFVVICIVLFFLGLRVLIVCLNWFIEICKSAIGIETLKEKKAREEREICEAKQREKDEEEAYKNAQHEAYMDKLFPGPEMRKRADEYLKADADEFFTAFSKDGIKSIVDRETKKRMQEGDKIVPFVKETLGLKDGDTFILAGVNQEFDKMTYDERIQYDVMNQDERNTFWAQWAKQFQAN